MQTNFHFKCIGFYLFYFFLQKKVHVQANEKRKASKKKVREKNAMIQKKKKKQK